MNARTSPTRGPSVAWLPTRACLFVLVGVLILAACGAEFGRDDAIVALQTTGVNEVEAACLADSLSMLGQLDAADPREPRTEERREAFVAASARCVQTEVLPVTVERSVDSEVNVSVLGSNETTPYVETAQSLPDDNSSVQSAESLNDAIAEAVAELQRQGRSEANARCVVQFLTGAQASHLFDDPNFGLGRDPLEASAIAACTSTQ